MKISELIKQLEKLPDQNIVIQYNYNDGFYSLHDVVLFSNGHIGNNGPILMLGEQIQTVSEKLSEN